MGVGPSNSCPLATNRKLLLQLAQARSEMIRKLSASLRRELAAIQVSFNACEISP